MLKKVFTLLLLSVFAVNLQGQQLDSDTCYAPRRIKLRDINVGLGGGFSLRSGLSLGINGTITMNSDLGISFSRKYYSCWAKNLPADYEAIFNAVDEMTISSLALVYVLPSETGNKRMGLEAGLSIINLNAAKFTPKPNRDSWPSIGSNYIV